MTVSSNGKIVIFSHLDPCCVRCPPEYEHPTVDLDGCAVSPMRSVATCSIMLKGNFLGSEIMHAM